MNCHYVHVQIFWLWSNGMINWVMTLFFVFYKGQYDSKTNNGFSGLENNLQFWSSNNKICFWIASSAMVIGSSWIFPELKVSWFWNGFLGSSISSKKRTNKFDFTGNALERVQRVHKPADLQEITFWTRRIFAWTRRIFCLIDLIWLF